MTTSRFIPLAEKEKRIEYPQLIYQSPTAKLYRLPKRTPSQSPEDIQARYMYKQTQKAMEETQRRAAEDRERALRELTASKRKALAEFAKVPRDVINEAIASQMFAGQRDVIEAQKAANLRNIQRSFYSGGSAPSGAMLSAAMSAERAATGQLAGAKREIDIERALKNWQSRFGVAKERAGIQTELAPTMAEVYGNTIAAVPKYSKAAPELRPTKYKEETFGRLPGELNIDFLKRDPEGYKRWWEATKGQTKSIRVRV